MYNSGFWRWNYNQRICFLIIAQQQEEWLFQRQNSFPFIIFEGNLDSHEKICLAADKQFLCSFTGRLVEAACRLLASYVFMFNYPVGWKNLFSYLQKCILHINDAQMLSGSVISLVNELDSLSKCN